MKRNKMRKGTTIASASTFLLPGEREKEPAPAGNTIESNVLKTPSQVKDPGPQICEGVRAHTTDSEAVAHTRTLF